MTASVLFFLALIAAMLLFTLLLVFLLLWVITGIIMTIPLWIIAQIADGIAYLIDLLISVPGRIRRRRQA